MLAVAFCFAVAVAAMLTAPRASAQPGQVESAARALQKKAMEEDYLATEFGKAQDKLESALSQCGTDPKVCPVNLRASLHRDLGVVRVGGQIDRAKGIASFIEALKLVPNIQLETDVYTKQLDAAFQEARKGVDKAAGPCGQLQGDFVHTPPSEQQQLTPIPIYVEYDGGEQLAKVGVRYKGFGMNEWKAAALERMGGKGWGGLVPPTDETCLDVREGAFQYYIVGQDANGDPLATSGDRINPYKVQIRRDPVKDPPHLPNRAPPAQCKYEGDCPPGFPCKDRDKAGTGGVCKEDRECQSRQCEGGHCMPPGKHEGDFCEEDSQCQSGKCENGECTAYRAPGPKKARRIWVGVFGALESAFVPSSNDVCKLSDRGVPQNSDNYYCTRDDGADYPYRRPTDGSTPDPIRENENAQLQPSGERSGGGALGNIRVMLSLDYALTSNILLGGRVGLVFNHYPGEEANTDGARFAVPLHLEVRGTYIFGNDPLNGRGFSPYAFLAGGISQFEAKVPQSVVELPSGSRDAVTKNVDAWHLAGPGFVSLGGGLRYAFIERAALMAALRGNLAFGSATAFSVGPEIGVQFGF